MELLTPTHFPDYELIDCGEFEKLERFGKYITIRPEPQAVWDKKLSEREWEKTAHVRFVPGSSSSGDWKKLKDMPDRWVIEYPLMNESQESRVKSQEESGNREHPANDIETANKIHILKFRLALTAFKHVGIFPEQAVNWDYISESVRLMKAEQPKVLNLFAYTGGASLAAKAAGADITHLDSIKQVVTWSKENMELSGLKDIRWIVEDALTFVKREVKRGKKYSGIILDPPAYGHGSAGEKWKLEDHINEMMKHVLTLLDDQQCFLILNTYSLGFSSLIIENLLSGIPEVNTGELYLHATSGHKLPLGVFGRFRKL
ncbi:MAG: class I SAM-dependent methyltransferase [Bacteroidetes bacterium]|nr:class I SAM-dependent methyltransferase [Bacteroidota bacterium]